MSWKSFILCGEMQVQAAVASARFLGVECSLFLASYKCLDELRIDVEQQALGHCYLESVLSNAAFVE